MIRRDDNIIIQGKETVGEKRYREGKNKKNPSSSHVIPAHEHLTHLLRRRTHRDALSSSRIACDVSIIKDVHPKCNGFDMIHQGERPPAGENLRPLGCHVPHEGRQIIYERTQFAHA